MSFYLTKQLEPFQTTISSQHTHRGTVPTVVLGHELMKSTETIRHMRIHTPMCTATSCAKYRIYNMTLLTATSGLTDFFVDDSNLASEFAEDMALGLELRKRVGRPWIAHLGSSAPKPGSPTYETARRTGRLIVERLGDPVGTGGSTGSMEGANRGAFEVDGGISVGYYLAGLPTEQYLNPYCTHHVTLKTLLARQHLLLAGAKGVIVALEGGWGTIFEVGHQLIEMRRKKFNPNCPIVFIDKDDLWGEFHGWMFRKLVKRGLWSGNEFDKLKLVTCPEAAVDFMGESFARAA